MKKTEITATAVFILSLLVLLTFADTAYGKGRNKPQRVVVQDSDSITVRIIDHDDDEEHHYYYDEYDHTYDDYHDDLDHDYDDDYDFDFDLDHDFDLDYDGGMRFVMPEMEFLIEGAEVQHEAALMQKEAALRQKEAVRIQKEGQRVQREGRRIKGEALRVQSERLGRQKEALRIQREDIGHWQEPGQVKQSYQDAYELVLQGKWKRALDAMNEYLRKYPSSRYEDDARFWICYSMEHEGEPDEQVFDVYNTFINDFGDRSSWHDDAKDSAIKIGRRLAAVNRKNKAKYGPIVDAMVKDANTEVALAALYSLQRNGGEHATNILLSTYDPESDEEYRKKVVMIIGRLEGPQVLQKLVDIASEDPSPEVRSAAIRSLGRSDGEAAVAALAKVARTANDNSLRVDAVVALGRLDIESAIEPLLDIAMNDTHVGVRTAAVSALGRMDSEAAQNALIKILQRK
jgi:TolA-binding protein